MRSFLGMINYLNRYSALSGHLAHPSAHSHIRLQTTSQGMFIWRTSNNWRWKFPMWRHFHTSTSMLRQPCKRMLPKRDSEHVWCRMVKLYVILPGHSQRLSRITRTWNERHEELYGEWKKFHYFPYGKEFTFQTDQKPLVSIYKKHMVDISLRVQRLIVSIHFHTCLSMLSTRKEKTFQLQMHSVE